MQFLLFPDAFQMLEADMPSSLRSEVRPADGFPCVLSAGPSLRDGDAFGRSPKL